MLNKRHVTSEDQIQNVLLLFDEQYVRLPFASYLYVWPCRFHNHSYTALQVSYRFTFAGADSEVAPHHQLGEAARPYAQVRFRLKIKIYGHHSMVSLVIVFLLGIWMRRHWRRRFPSVVNIFAFWTSSMQELATISASRHGGHYSFKTI